jgi:acetolactate synthase I/II/III large subunit
MVNCFESEGISAVFGIAATSNIRYMLTRHERAAASMAGRYGQVTGRAAVVTATLGPGAINMQLGVADATTNSTPMVAVFAPVTRWSDACRSHSRFRRCSARPFKLVETERPAAVYLAIPNARCSICALAIGSTATRQLCR